MTDNHTPTRVPGSVQKLVGGGEGLQGIWFPCGHTPAGGPWGGQRTHDSGLQLLWGKRASRRGCMGLLLLSGLILSLPSGSRCCHRGVPVCTSWPGGPLASGVLTGGCPVCVPSILGKSRGGESCGGLSCAVPCRCVRSPAASCSARAPAAGPSTSPASGGPGPQRGGSPAASVLQASAVPSLGWPGGLPAVLHTQGWGHPHSCGQWAGASSVGAPVFPSV